MYIKFDDHSLYIIILSIMHKHTQRERCVNYTPHSNSLLMK